MHEPGALVRGYTAVVHKCRFVILLLWLIGLGLASWRGIAFLGKTNNDLDPPKGVPSYAAAEAFGYFFPAQADTDVVAILIENTGRVYDTVLNNQTRDASLYIADYASAYQQEVAQTTGYYILLAGGVDKAYAEPFLSKSKQQLIIVFHVNSWADDYISDMIKGKLGDIEAKFFPDGSARVRMTGDPTMNDVIGDDITHDLELSDGISIPTALLVLVITLSSLKFVTMPVLSLAISIMVTFGIGVPVAEHRTVVSYAANLCMSVAIALSIDYSLFILSRFREEIRHGADVYKAVEISLWSSGHTVLVSGLTLGACLLGLLIFPVDLLTSMGLMAAITVFACIVINLTLTPAMLFAFPNFWKKAVTTPWPWSAYMRAKCGTRTGCCSCRGDDDVYDLPESVPLSSDPSSHTSNGGEPATTFVDSTVDSSVQALVTSNGDRFNFSKLQRSRWYRLGVVVTKYRWLFFLGITAIAGAFAYPALTIEFGGGPICRTPRGAVRDTYVDIIHNFGGGFIFPYALVMVAPENQTAFSKEGFNLTTRVIEKYLTPLSQSPPEAIAGLMYANGQTFEYERYASCVQDYDLCRGNVPPNCTVPCGLAAEFLNLNDESHYKQATMVIIRTPADPIEPAGGRFLHDARRGLKQAEAEFPGWHFYMADGGSFDTDMITSVYSRLWLAIVVTGALVVVSLAVAFRSVLMPLLSVFTLICNLAIVYGMVSLVYQHGILNWLHIPFLQPCSTGVSWIPPVLVFGMLIGLGVDYQVFLLTRIQENRLAGRSNRTAITLGLAQTGSIITSAGVIMAVAFLGLMAARESLLNQLSFFLAFAVLVDTFIIRCMLTPSIMAILGDWNYWPRQLPARIVTIYDPEDEDDELLLDPSEDSHLLSYN